MSDKGYSELKYVKDEINSLKSENERLRKELLGAITAKEAREIVNLLKHKIDECDSAFDVKFYIGAKNILITKFRMKGIELEDGGSEPEKASSDAIPKTKGAGKA